jgi:restriction system protein
MWPTVEAIRAIGGSGTIQEIAEKAIEISGFSEDQQNMLHGKGPQTEIEYRLAWARTYLKIAGALDNSGRGIWSLTEKGRALAEVDISAAVREVRAKVRAERRQRPVKPAKGGLSVGDDESAEQDWKQRLLDELLAMPPDRFERLAQRLLREAGFISVTVTGRSGDEGIDGLGVYRLVLGQFPRFLPVQAVPR